MLLDVIESLHLEIRLEWKVVGFTIGLDYLVSRLLIRKCF